MNQDWRNRANFHNEAFWQVRQQRNSSAWQWQSMAEKPTLECFLSVVGTLVRLMSSIWGGFSTSVRAYGRIEIDVDVETAETLKSMTAPHF